MRIDINIVVPLSGFLSNGNNGYAVLKRGNNGV